MVATYMGPTEGRYLHFSNPAVPLKEKVSEALGEFRAKNEKVAPRKIMLHPDHEPLRAEVEALVSGDGIEVVFTNSILSNHIWIGGPKVQGGAAVRKVESRARVLAAVDVIAPVVTQQVIAVAVPECEEEIEVEITPGWVAAMRSYFQVSRLALPAPKIAGLLLAVNPRGPEVASVDAGEDEEESELPPMVLNREWVEAWQVVHAPIEANPRAGITQGMADRNREILRTFIADAAKFFAPVQPLVQGASAAEPGPMYGPELPPPAQVLPQDITQHPRDLMKELAEAKSQPQVLSIEARLEQAAMDRAAVSPDKVRDFLEALEYAVNHREDAQAQLLVDGHRFLKHGKQGQIKVKHPSLKVEPMLVAVQLHRSDGYRFVAKAHEVRAYLSTCAREFEARKITPISAGELYPGEAAKAA